MLTTIVPAALSASLLPSEVAITIIGSINHPINGTRFNNQLIKVLKADVPLVQSDLSDKLMTLISIAFFPQLCPSPKPSFINVYTRGITYKRNAKKKKNTEPL